MPRALPPCATRPQPIEEKARDRRRDEKEERKRRNGSGKNKKIGNKKENYYLFLEIMIHKLYYPYYYWLIKIEDDIYIN
jgi:hypothetical protein